MNGRIKGDVRSYIIGKGNEIGVFGSWNGINDSGVDRFIGFGFRGVGFLCFIGFEVCCFYRGRLGSRSGDGIWGGCNFGDFMSVGIFLNSDFMGSIGIGEMNGVGVEVDVGDFFGFGINKAFHFFYYLIS